MRDISLDDYRSKGVMAALDAIGDICPGAKVHAAGYCLGGTLLAIAAAAMARDGDDRLASVTLFCAQTDFTEAGELQLFITEDQLAFLDDVMRAQGYLDARQMAGAFQLLRSNDLIWSRLVKSYLLGERGASERPDGLERGRDAHARAHARRISAPAVPATTIWPKGAFASAAGRSRCATSALPMFVVGTETDHIAPWRSVYKIHLLNDARHHLRARPPAATTPASSASPAIRTGISAIARRDRRRALRRPRRMARRRPATRGLVVAGLGGLAG